jgi:hypothetical protein
MRKCENVAMGGSKCGDMAMWRYGDGGSKCSDMAMGQCGDMAMGESPGGGQQFNFSPSYDR